MSSRSTNRTINIRAVDSSTSTLMGMVRIMRAVGQEIRILTMLMTALAAAEDAATFGAGSLSKIFRLGLLAVAGGVAITTATTAMPVTTYPAGQTLPGQFRTVQATGPALVHAGEIISRPKSGEGFGAGPNLVIQELNISNEGLPPDQAWQRTKDRLRTLTFAWPR